MPAGRESRTYVRGKTSVSKPVLNAEMQVIFDIGIYG